MIVLEMTGLYGVGILRQIRQSMRSAGRSNSKPCRRRLRDFFRELWWL